METLWANLPIPHLQEQDDMSSDEEPHFSLVTGRYMSSTKTRVKNNVDGTVYIYGEREMIYYLG